MMILMERLSLWAAELGFVPPLAAATVFAASAQRFRFLLVLNASHFYATLPVAADVIRAGVAAGHDHHQND